MYEIQAIDIDGTLWHLGEDGNWHKSYLAEDSDLPALFATPAIAQEWLRANKPRVRKDFVDCYLSDGVLSFDLDKKHVS